MKRTLIALTLMLASAARAGEDPELATDWTVSVFENGVERKLSAIEPNRDRTFKFVVDQRLAPGWTCVVRPQQWRAGRSFRWMTCEFAGRARASIRTECRSDRTGSRMQELWLGDEVSVQLSCRSGMLP